MDVLIWTGAAVSILGLIGVVYCIVRVMSARKSSLTDEQLKVILQKVLPLNMAALFISVIGLMMVILGISFSSS